MIPQKWYRPIHACRVRHDAQVAQAGGVQRLFSMFPRGLPGSALLLLRASAAVALLAEHYAYRNSLSTLTLVAVVLLSLALSVGYLTPIAAIVGLFLHGLVWLHLGAISVPFVIIVTLDSIALALLGPGAYSADGYRFGRRVVVLPPC